MTTEILLKIKYNRVSTLQQTGSRFELDDGNYDLVLLDKISGSVPFKERPKAKEIIKLVEEGKVSEITIEEFSRLGRNTGDCISTLEWLEQKEINVFVRNLGLQSRPKGEKNPIWSLISAVLSSVYTMELENIRERTDAGRKIFLQNGGRLGRPNGTNESEKQFLGKKKTQEVLKLLNKKRTAREIAAILHCSTKTVQKVKTVASKYGLFTP